MAKIDDLSALRFGDKIKVVWNTDESYVGLVFGDKIGYEDGNADTIEVIAEHRNRGLCEVYYA